MRYPALPSLYTNHLMKLQAGHCKRHAIISPFEGQRCLIGNKADTGRRRIHAQRNSNIAEFNGIFNHFNSLTAHGGVGKQKMNHIPVSLTRNCDDTPIG